jgi:hypothetical protein
MVREVDFSLVYNIAPGLPVLCDTLDIGAGPQPFVRVSVYRTLGSI